MEFLAAGSGGSGGGGRWDQIKRNPGFAEPGQGHPGGGDEATEFRF